MARHHSPVTIKESKVDAPCMYFIGMHYDITIIVFLGGETPPWNKYISRKLVFL